VPGEVLSGLAECVRGEWSVESAAVVAPGLVVVVMVRGFEVWGEEEAVVLWACDCWGEEVALLWIALWALKAARKLERKGRCVGMFASVFMCGTLLVSLHFSCCHRQPR
jgi:hypothetical protein